MAEQQPSLFSRTVRRAVAASGITAAIAYTWWQAIENARTPPAPPEAQLGAPLALGRVELTPLSLQLRHAPSAPPGERTLLVLSAKIENITGETQPAALGRSAPLVAAEADHAAFGAPEITLLRDRRPLRQLQPRMAEEVEIVWHAPEHWRPETVSLTFSRQQFKLKDNLYGRSSWLGYSAAAYMAATPELGR